MKEWLKNLCEKTNMPEEVTEYIMMVGNNRTEMDDGLSVLAARLREAEDTYRIYQKKGISDQIFYDTMACFSRFVKEYKESFGKYGFDRDFWITRQLSGVLFRIGELEYEMVKEQGEDVISVHIPSDAHIDSEHTGQSYLESVDFFARYFPEYHYREYICGSWMLSPALKEILPAESNIIRFQEAYDIYEWDKESDEYKQWIFKDRSLSLEQVPQNTSLQRKAKAYLQAGGLIGEAIGRLKKEYTVVK